MPTKNALCCKALLVVTLIVAWSNSTRAEFVIGLGSFFDPQQSDAGFEFTNTGPLDGHTSSSPISTNTVEFLHGSDSVILTTVTVGPSGTLNENGGLLAINASGGSDTPAAFDADEFWTFSFSTATRLTGIDFGLLTRPSATDPASEEFVVTIGNQTFNFFETETGSSSDDRFTAADSNGRNFSDLTINANQQIKIQFAGLDSDTGTIEGLRFEALTTSAVPEPSSLTLFAMAIGGLILRHRKPTYRD